VIRPQLNFVSENYSKLQNAPLLERDFNDLNIFLCKNFLYDVPAALTKNIFFEGIRAVIMAIKIGVEATLGSMQLQLKLFFMALKFDELN
jgi:hypothetical protein